MAVVPLLALLGVTAGGEVSRCVVVRDTTTAQDVRIEQWGENAVRVRAVPAGGAFRDDLVSALVPPSDGYAAGACEHITMGRSSDSTPSSVTSGNLQATLGTDGLLRFTRIHDSKLLLSEGRARQISPTTTTPPLPGFSSLQVSFNPGPPAERIYGLGQHKTGVLNNRNYSGSFSMAPHNTEIFIPVMHSSEGYAFLMNLPSFGQVDLRGGTNWTISTVVQADFWVATTGADEEVSPWAQLQASYANATGHAPVYPEWASGFWQSKNRYHNQTQLLDVARGYISRGYPLSLIIIDYYSWSPGPLGDEVLPAACWPDPRGMREELAEMGVELMISPYFHSVQSSSKYYSSALKEGLLVVGKDGKPAQVAYDAAYLYDVFNPKAREYAWGAVEAGYVQQYGIHNWWLDCDEPCGGDMTELVYNNGTWPASFVGAAYPHMVDKMVYEGGGEVMLGRSAWAGSQRFGGAVWSGDTTSNFENLNQQFRAGLNMVMSGIPYWTTDIGGYSSGNIDSPSFRELIVRWFQWGAFCPLFRLHGRRSGGPNEDGGSQCGKSGSSNEIWNFGNESEAAIARVMRIREQLRPYVMEQYAAASSSGTPIIRPLFFDFWKDEGAAEVDDQMMFGPDYLVAPQLKSLATSRGVYLPPLPKGTVWVNVFSQAQHDTSAGGVTITEQTPLTGEGFGTFPLYKKSSSSTYPPASL